MRYILLLTVLLASNAFAALSFDETMASAKDGDAMAQHNLGLKYANGDGVPENDAEAVKWFRKAADQGDAKAQVDLGLMYAEGNGVPQDSIRAYVWWSIAQKQGDIDAANDIEILKSRMSQQQIADAQALAAKCYESNYKDCD